MNWKTWPYWVKGLLIGFVAGILFDLYAFYHKQELFSEYPQCSIGTPCPLIFEPILMYSYMVVSFICATLLGVILGYLYDKIRNRRIAKIT